MSSQATIAATDTPVRKSVTVQASPDRAFHVFTAELDSWWPRTHHIGKSPMTKALIEGHPGGRCYSEQADGTECDWGSILVWEPPHRFVMAWRITPQWQFEADLAKSSEVEVTFTPQPDGSTRVDLEHRFFSRIGTGGDNMRTQVDSPGGWGMLMQLYAKRIVEAAQ
jgi:uncharacterized protein YndB with AHSA1/START domain